MNSKKDKDKDKDIPVDDGYRGDFRIITEAKEGEVAHGGNTKVYLDDKMIPGLDSCHVRIVAQGPVKIFLEIIPNVLDIEMKNIEANVKFAYHDTTPMWHGLKELIKERNERNSEGESDDTENISD